MSKILQAVDSLEEKLEKILERYRFLKEENDLLLANIDALQHLVQQQEEALEDQREQYRLLKIAKTIQGSKENSKETKQKINALIREIDRCIVKLNL